MAPNFNWQSYFRELKLPPFQIINVVPSTFFKEVNSRLADEPLENWKSYLRFHVADRYAPYLSSAFVQENFDFYSKYLRGAKEQQPRWRRCVRYTDSDLGEALGQAYVAKVFSPELKASTRDMVKRIGVKQGYLENQAFAPQVETGRNLLWARGAATTGRPYLARAAEEHSGPHMPWFWQGKLQGAN